MSYRGPLAGRYPAAVALVVLALTPYLVLTTALEPLGDMIAGDTGLGETGFGLTAGMANAAYAFGTVIGLQLAVHLCVRRLLVCLSFVFVLSSVAVAWSPLGGFFVAGRVLQGLTTGAMLIAAVPPLVLGFGSEKLRGTAMVMNMGIFGAVAVGPAVGGAVAGTGTWHPFLWIVAGLGTLGFFFTILTFEDKPPQDPDAPRDVIGVGLLAAGMAALFFGVSWVAGHHLISVTVLVPALSGLALLVAGLAYEVRARNPLMPIRQLGHTLPFAGITIACAAAAGSVAFIQLTSSGLVLAGKSPYDAGTLFWPLLGGALLSASLFGALFFTRWTPVLALSGLLVLAGGGTLLLSAGAGDSAAVLVGTGLVGFGTGSSVAPALFTAGFSLKSMQLPRVFALVELLRGVAAFLVGPLLLHLAETTGATPEVGLRTATWIGIGIAAGGFVVATSIFLLGGARTHQPRVQEWLDGDGTAFDSPPVFARLRAVERDVVRARSGTLAPAVALSVIAGVAVLLGLWRLEVVPEATAATVLIAGGGTALACGLASLVGATGQTGGGLSLLGTAWAALGILLLVLPLADREPVLAVVALCAGGGLLALAPSRSGVALATVLVAAAGTLVLAGLDGLLTGTDLSLPTAVTDFALAAVALLAVPAVLYGRVTTAGRHAADAAADTRNGNGRYAAPVPERVA